jgi:hypothetical protein
MMSIDQLSQNQFINLETFRKSGVGVKTPVWFVLDGDTIYVRTVANSGKVKRIRNNGQVQIAPCKADGALLGEWLPALAREVIDEPVSRKVDRLLGRKYGFQKVIFSLLSTLQRRKGTILEIKLQSGSVA